MTPVLSDSVQRFAGYVATLGRGPGRSRALTREEARDALDLVLAGGVDPAQLGAFLMLLRYRGEDPDEIAGLVDAARAHIGSLHDEAAIGAVDLDWPSYGAGRTREVPWFLLAALALGRSGVRVLMHGTNAFGSGLSVEDGLAALGLHASESAASVGEALARERFAYWPIRHMAPRIDRLLAMRALFGLRSPINTVARLIDPADSSVSVDGVFHPPYIAVHLAVAERFGRRSLVVIKGGGGEAERTPLKPVAAHCRGPSGPRELVLPALAPDSVGMPVDAATFAAVWTGQGAFERAERTVVGTIALALLALEPELEVSAADAKAAAIWGNRHRAVRVVPE
ncbi:glycosyl transferase family protein [Acetobacteraceae bacterium KSS8]|uniref:Glycosyl transferase family protein n=1 Tax=Endosaccharibacter trunci TaxID=2812733 RepID=A0ABT1WAG3_9PROT|nr:glycosyl transferase family protein [Acetobacteraceae bacterium KSS8]